jgi:predicted lipoprotein with Yx(FWY)xxD motif
MARGLRLLAMVLSAQLGVGAAWAQPTDIPLPAAKTTEFPPGVSVAKIEGGQVYVAADGRTLYGLDLRTVNRWAVDSSKYCVDRCDEWEPLLAPANAKPNLNLFRGFGRRRPGAAPAAPPAAPTPAAAAGATPAAAGANPAAPAGAAPAGGDAERQQQLAAAFGLGGAPTGMYTQQNAPDWTIVEGPAGPQWVYKGYHMVYVRKGDQPRSTAYDGTEGRTWNTLKFIPPVPEIKAPNGVGVAWLDDAYLLTDKDGKVLYTGDCGSNCSSWTPLAAPLVSQGLGDWTVDRSAPRPQWLYRGKPVFVAADETTASLPGQTVALRP